MFITYLIGVVLGSAALLVLGCPFPIVVAGALSALAARVLYRLHAYRQYRQRARQNRRSTCSRL